MRKGSTLRYKNIFYICSSKAGGLAQLARALDWQSKGQGFDSPILQKAKGNG